MKNILSTAEDAVRFGKDLGVDEVEAYVVSINRKGVILSDTSWDFYSSHTDGLGIRVLQSKKTGFFATSSLENKEVEAAVKIAYKIAKVSEPDKEWVSLPRKTGIVNVEQTYDKEIAEIEPSRLIHDATQMVNAVKNYGDRVAITRGEVSTEMTETAISNNHNCNLYKKGTFALTNVSVKAEETGTKSVSNESQETRNLGKLNCHLVAQTAATRALKILNAKRIPSGEMPIVWRNKVFASALRTMFGRTLCADYVQKGRSPWIGKVGECIASNNFNLVDDGVMKAGLRTSDFDDDGIPQSKVSLIFRGVLQGFLYDSYTANKERRESTGNARRDFRNLPAPAPNNLILEPGKAKNQELIKDIRRGLYLFETIGMWLSNPISGYLNATATNAFLIEDGALTQAVKGIIISGNFFDILRHRIDLIANDVQNLGATYSPSVRISEMRVTGV